MQLVDQQHKREVGCAGAGNVDDVQRRRLLRDRRFAPRLPSAPSKKIL